MTPDKVREVLAIYRKKFEDMHIPNYPFPHHKIPNRGQADIDFNNQFHYNLAHCHNMLDQMEIFIQEGRMDKVFRWLGFIQGVLWAAGIYTVEEMANHNRP